MNWFTVFYKSGYVQLVTGSQSIDAFLIPFPTVDFIIAGDQRNDFVFEDGKWSLK